MTSLDNYDRKRQRVKSKKQSGWARPLVNPLTFKTLVKFGLVGAKALYWIYRIIEAFRS